MKKLLYAGPFVAALLCPAPAALGGWFHRGGCDSCGDCAAPAADQIYLKATITEQKYTKTVPPAVPGPGAKVTSGTTDVCTTKLVECDVVDPHTGCVTKQLKPVTVVEKAKTTTIEVTPPPPADCTPKTEEQVRRNVTIYIQHGPACLTPGH
jgi:hypothetical protein